MATKKDLVEAQAFSRRRLTTAFTSGAPGGREVEPQRPMRAVIGGLGLSLLLGVGGLAAGVLKPSVPSGWDEGSLVIARTSGARYVAIQKQLYPIVNTTTARLLIPASEFKVVTVDDATISQSPRGSTTIGIEGAPDALPSPAGLTPSGWVSCTRDGGIRTQVGTSRHSSPAAGRAVVVRTGGAVFVVTGGYRLPVPRGEQSAVLRALHLDTAAPVEAPKEWTNLFPEGPQLAPLQVDNVGAHLDGAPHGATVGTVLRVSGDGSTPRRYVVTSKGLAPLTPWAYALYQLGTGAGVGPDLAVSQAEVSSLSNTTVAKVPEQWPTDLPTALDQTPCVTLDAGRGRLPQVHLSTSTDMTPEAGRTDTRVDSGTGAVVRAVASGVTALGPVSVIDQTATAFTLKGYVAAQPQKTASGSDPGQDDTDLDRLGFSAADIVSVPQAWLGLFRSGPTLSRKAAGSAISPGR